MAWNMTDFNAAPWNGDSLYPYLTQEERDFVSGEFNKYITNYEPTSEFPACDTWYLTVSFNHEHYPNGKYLNGITTEDILYGGSEGGGV